MKRRSLWAAGVVLLVVALAGILAIETGYAQDGNA
jgi:ABC-type transport system involved in cytochrome c biogenesis permease component